MKYILTLLIAVLLASCTISVPDCPDEDGGIGGTGACEQPRDD